MDSSTRLPTPTKLDYAVGGIRRRLRQMARRAHTQYLKWTTRTRTPRRLMRSDRLSGILVVETRHLGDVLFATPAFHSLKIAYPAARIAAMVHPAFTAILKNNSDVDEILPYEDCRYASAVERVASGQYDLACVLDRDERMAQMIFQAGVPQRIGYDRPENLPYLTEAVSRAERGASEIRWSMKLAMSAGGAACDETPKIFPDDGWRERVEHRQLGIGAYALIHPGSDSGAAYKRWPVDRFAQVAARLADIGVPVVLTGVAEETHLAAAFRTVPPARRLFGQTTIGDLIELIAGARIVITNDTGPAHIAASLGRPCVVVTGFADPKIYHPYAAPHRALFNPIACSPCFGSRFDPQDCPYHSCLKAVTVDDVMRAVDERLQSPVTSA